MLCAGDGACPWGLFLCPLQCSFWAGSSCQTRQTLSWSAAFLSRYSVKLSRLAPENISIGAASGQWAVYLSALLWVACALCGLARDGCNAGVHLTALGLLSMVVHCMTVDSVVLVGCTGLHKTGQRDAICPAHHEPESIWIFNLCCFWYLLLLLLLVLSLMHFYYYFWYLYFYYQCY